MSEPLTFVAIDAATDRVAEILRRLYPDFPFHLEAEGTGVLGDMTITFGPDLHDEGRGSVAVRVTEYDRLPDAEAALLSAGLDYLSGHEWRDPDVMAALCAD